MEEREQARWVDVVAAGTMAAELAAETMRSAATELAGLGCTLRAAQLRDDAATLEKWFSIAKAAARPGRERGHEKARRV